MKQEQLLDGVSTVLRILLAEDNPGDVLLVRQALAEHNLRHELWVATDGEEALRYIEQMGMANSMRCPDIFLLDLNLPKIDGIEILERLRNHSECREMRVVVLSSSERWAEPKRLNDFAIEHYFKKPYDLDGFMQLGALVKAVCHNVPVDGHG